MTLPPWLVLATQLIGVAASGFVFGLLWRWYRGLKRWHDTLMKLTATLDTERKAIDSERRWHYGEPGYLNIRDNEGSTKH